MITTPLALTIFLSTIGISLYTLYKNHSLLYRMMFSPYDVAHNGKYYTFITSGFVHLDMPHLLFNMFTFFFFAFSLEGKIGSLNFAIIYFGSLIFSDLSTYFKHKDNPDYRSLGASGAISGVLFSSILFSPESSIMIFPIPIPIPAIIFGFIYLAWCYYAARQSSDNINHSAHFWGAVIGIILTLIIDISVVESIKNYINSVFS